MSVESTVLAQRGGFAVASHESSMLVPLQALINQSRPRRRSTSVRSTERELWSLSSALHVRWVHHGGGSLSTRLR